MMKKKKTKYSNAGKGDKSRITDKNKFDKNWEKIFGKKKITSEEERSGNEQKSETKNTK